MTRMLLTHGPKLGVSDTDISHILGQVDTHNHGNRFERIHAGSLTAGNANAFAFYWQNPHPWDVIIYELMIEVTTAGGTAGSVLDAGSAASSSTHSDDLINDGDLNTAGFLVSTARVRLDEQGGTTDYITGQILTANAASLVGKYYLRYVEV